MVAKDAGMAGISVWRLNGEEDEMWARTRPFAQSISEQPLTVELKPDALVKLGEPITFSAAVRPATAVGASRSVANVPIRLQQQNSDKSWSDVAIGTTDVTGNVVFTINAILSRFRVSTDSVTGTWKPATSTEVMPTIERTIELSQISATPTTKRGLIVAGTVTPASLEAPLELQRRVNKKWIAVGSATLQEGGVFRLKWNKPPSGSHILRLSTPAALSYPAVVFKLGKITVK